MILCTCDGVADSTFQYLLRSCGLVSERDSFSDGNGSGDENMGLFSWVTRYVG